MLFLALYRVFKSMEPLSFDSVMETGVVRRSLSPVTSMQYCAPSVPDSSYTCIEYLCSTTCSLPFTHIFFTHLSFLFS